MKVFEEDEIGIESASDDQESRFIVKIKNPMQFGLVIDYLSAGLTFRQIENVIGANMVRTGMARIGCCNDTQISQYV